MIVTIVVTEYISVDGVVEAMELAHMHYRKGRTYEDYIGKAGLRRLGVGRGEEVYPVEDLAAIAVVIVTPEVGVSTPRAFAHWDALAESAGDLRSAGQPGRLSPRGPC